MSASRVNGPETGVDSKRVKLSSLFSHLEVAPPVEIFNLKDRYLADNHPDKINLSVGGEPLHLLLSHMNATTS